MNLIKRIEALEEKMQEAEKQPECILICCVDASGAATLPKVITKLSFSGRHIDREQDEPWITFKGRAIEAARGFISPDGIPTILANGSIE